jgi:hypothetical protein
MPPAMTSHSEGSAAGDSADVGAGRGSAQLSKLPARQA